jgi:hypothetical protein
LDISFWKKNSRLTCVALLFAPAYKKSTPPPNEHPAYESGTMPKKCKKIKTDRWMQQNILQTRYSISLDLANFFSWKQITYNNNTKQRS